MPSDTIEGKYQRLAINNIDIPIDNPMSMGEALNIMDAIKGKISMNRLGADYQKTAKDLVDKFGKKEIIDILSELEPMRKAGNLPDLPYKGNDYIDLAVKDIMKLAAEGNYDRVAYTNSATQLQRNRKDLEYIDSIEINQVPFLTKAEQQFNEDFVRTDDR